MKRTLLAALAGGLAAWSSGAEAVPMLTLADGVQTVTVFDGGAGDSSPAVGAVGFIGSVGNFIVNIAGGVTKPVIGAADQPQIDLLSLSASSSAGGTLTISFSDGGFTLGGSGVATSASIGGTTSGTVGYNAYLNDGTAQFLLASASGLTGPSFSADFGSMVSNPNVPYSLREVVTINHLGAGITSFDAWLRVPEPATLVLLASGLLGLLLVVRRRAGAST
jgi:hypothetical protein